MKFIANLIVKSNQWYENLPDKKGSLFYNSLVFIPYALITFGLIFIMPSKSGIFECSMGLCWILLVCLWRLSFDWIKYRSKKG